MKHNLMIAFSTLEYIFIANESKKRGVTIPSLLRMAVESYFETFLFVEVEDDE